MRGNIVKDAPVNKSITFFCFCIEVDFICKIRQETGARATGLKDFEILGLPQEVLKTFIACGCLVCYL